MYLQGCVSINISICVCVCPRVRARHSPGPRPARAAASAPARRAPAPPCAPRAPTPSRRRTPHCACAAAPPRRGAPSLPPRPQPAPARGSARRRVRGFVCPCGNAGEPRPHRLSLKGSATCPRGLLPLCDSGEEPVQGGGAEPRRAPRSLVGSRAPRCCCVKVSPYELAVTVGGDGRPGQSGIASPQEARSWRAGFATREIPTGAGLSQEGTARLRSPLRVTHRRGCGDPGVQPLGAFADLVCTDVTVVRENKHKTFL